MLICLLVMSKSRCLKDAQLSLISLFDLLMAVWVPLPAHVGSCNKSQTLLIVSPSSLIYLGDQDCIVSLNFGFSGDTLQLPVSYKTSNSHSNRSLPPTHEHTDISSSSTKTLWLSLKIKFFFVRLAYPSNLFDLRFYHFQLRQTCLTLHS